MHCRQLRSGLPKEYQNFNINIPEERRFTPTPDDIKILEKNLRLNIKNINKDRPNQGKDFGPIIHKHLRKYLRQYLGLIDKNGNKIIWVNFIKRPTLIQKIRDFYDASEGLQEDWIFILDGGSYYWQIKYNLNSGEFFDFSVNGIA